MTKVLVICSGVETCCSEDPRLPNGSHPLNLLPQAARCKSPQDCLLTACEGGMSSPQSSTQYISASDFGKEYFQNITVERGAREDIIILVLPGVSVDVRFDVRLMGEQERLWKAYEDWKGR